MNDGISRAGIPDAGAEMGAPLSGRMSRRKRSLAWAFVAVALVSSMVGGVTVMALAPGYIAARVPANPPQTSQVPPSAASPQGALGQTNVEQGPAVYVAKRLTPAVVGIVNKAVAGYDLFGRAYLKDLSGSGVIFDKNGYIVTNNHVIERARELKVFLWDGRVLPAKVIGADPPTDLAVIKVDAQDLPTAEFGDSDKLELGEIAVAIGNPLGMEFKSSVTVGVISGLNRVLQIGEEKFKLIQTDAVINPGNSGGPLANAKGQVIGINTMKISDAEGMGFAIPINTAKTIINDLLTKGRVPRAWLGIYLIDRATAQRYGYDIKIDKGVYVVDVATGGPAAKAGIRKEDVIIALDGKEIADASALRAALAERRAGDVVSLLIRRKGRDITVQVTLGEVPADTER